MRDTDTDTDTDTRRKINLSKETGGRNLIQYKGYVGKVEFDDEAGIFHGEVINLRDVITFRGDSVAELRQALKDSVDEYLEYCDELGRKPEKPYSGRFIVRIDPELHRRIVVRAKSEELSLNRWVDKTLERAMM